MQLRLFSALILATMLLSAGCAINPATGRSQLSLMSMSTDEEVSLGQKSYPHILQKMGGAYPDDQLQSYVQAVGDRLVSASHRKDLPYTFKVLNESTPNAFALPGGYIAITRGLLVNLETEAQLAAVLGHEIGHVDARHAVQGMQRSNLLGLGLAVLSGVTAGAEYGSLIQSSGEVAATLLDRSYSRGQEEESDQLGIDYMVSSGYDPQGAVELQKIFYQKIDKGENPQWLEGLFRTHPFSKKRMDENREYISAKYAQLKQPVDSGSRFPLMLAPLREVQPAYEIYDQARAEEKNGQAGKAITLYLQASAMAPDEALILTGLGISYIRAEDFVSARHHLLRAVKLDSHYYLSHLGLSFAYLNQGSYSQTIKHADKSFKLLPTVEATYFLARGHEGGGDKAKAIELYKVVQNYDPKSKMGRNASDRILVLEGKK